jgi:hypothetical protein
LNKWFFGFWRFSNTHKQLVSLILIFLDTQKLMVDWKIKELPNTSLFQSATNFLTTYSHLIMFSIFNSHLNTLTAQKMEPAVTYLLAFLMVHSHLMWNQC